MSGGEPFLYPGFVNLCRQLTRKNHISINTNLSTSNVVEFAESIPSEKTVTVNAAFHIDQREQRRSGVDRFIGYVNLLQNKGFNIRVEFVIHPSLFPRVAKDMALLHEQGVRIVNLKMSRGFWEGRLYPESYTASERTLLAQHVEDSREMRLLGEEVDIFGKMCSAGHDFLVMNISGNVRRCDTARRSYGNFFGGTYRVDKVHKACPFSRCRLAYQGMRCVRGDRTSIPSAIVDASRERSLEARRRAGRYGKRLLAHFGA